MKHNNVKITPLEFINDKKYRLIKNKIIYVIRRCGLISLKKNYYGIISIIIKNIGITIGVRQKVCGKIDDTVFVHRIKRYGMPVLRLFILKKIKDNISDQSIALDNNFCITIHVQNIYCYVHNPLPL